jgi:hypothetical protein
MGERDNTVRRITASYQISIDAARSSAQTALGPGKYGLTWSPLCTPAAGIILRSLRDFDWRDVAGSWGPAAPSVTSAKDTFFCCGVIANGMDYWVITLINIAVYRRQPQHFICRGMPSAESKPSAQCPGYSAHIVRAPFSGDCLDNLTMKRGLRYAGILSGGAPFHLSGDTFWNSVGS